MGTMTNGGRSVTEIADTLTKLAVASLERSIELAGFPAAADREATMADLLASLASDLRQTSNPTGGPGRRPKRPDAFAFWSAHGEAQRAIGEVWGPRWALVAPIGESVLATVPACYRAATSERGTRIKWRADCRMPAAKYWPGGSIPDGLIYSLDYPRHVPADAADLVADAAD